MAEQMAKKQAERLRKALEERGICQQAATELAAALRARLEGRSATELEALMDGVEFGCQVQRAITRAEPAAASRELERLFEDFAIELKKLDEGLRALAAHANRLRKHAEPETSETIH